MHKQQTCDSARLGWGASAFDMNEREGHLSSTERGSQGVGIKGKRKEGEGCGVKAPSFSLSSVLTVNLMATDHSADSTSALFLLLLSLSQTYPPFHGAPGTFVPFISTTNTYRCSEKEEAERQRISKNMLPPLNDC